MGEWLITNLGRMKVEVRLVKQHSWMCGGVGRVSDARIEREIALLLIDGKKAKSQDEKRC